MKLLLLGRDLLDLFGQSIVVPLLIVLSCLDLFAFVLFECLDQLAASKIEQPGLVLLSFQGILVQDITDICSGMLGRNDWLSRLGLSSGLLWSQSIRLGWSEWRRMILVWTELRSELGRH